MYNNNLEEILGTKTLIGNATTVIFRVVRGERVSREAITPNTCCIGFARTSLLANVPTAIQIKRNNPNTYYALLNIVLPPLLHNSRILRRWFRDNLLANVSPRPLPTRRV